MNKKSDYNRYYYFYFVYKEKNFSTAAKKLNISQPAISYAIKNLEDELNVQLFFRLQNGVEATEEADRLFDFVSVAINSIKAGQKEIKKINELNYGVISIGVQSHILKFFLEKYLFDFNKIYKSITFEIIDKSSKEMIKMMENRDLDLIIDTFPIISEKNMINIDKLFKVKNVFLVKKDTYDDLKFDTKIDVLLKKPLIISNKGSSSRKKLESFLTNKGITIYPKFQTWTTEIMLDLVKNRMGVGYFMKEAIMNEITSNDFYIYQYDDLPNEEICLAYINEYQSIASRTFINFVIKNMEKDYGKK